MDIKNSITKAIDFLELDFNTKGHWEDFSTLAGKSTFWVTGYIAFHLHLFGHQQAINLIERSWRFLSKDFLHLPKSKWGFNRLVPADADSTIWILRLALHLQKGTRSIEKAKSFVAKHVHANGGVCTYENPKLIRLFTRVKSSVSFDGWCQDHVCVTAAILGIKDLVNNKTIQYVLDSQLKNGSWSAYWWNSKAYATALMVEGLSYLCNHSFNQSISESIKRSFVWSEKELNFNQQASPFELSFLLRILSTDSCGQYRQIIHSNLNLLIKLQLADGSWRSSAPLCIPPPNVTNPCVFKNWVINGKGGGSIIYDLNRSFTTVSVLYAIEKANNYLYG